MTDLEYAYDKQNILKRKTMPYTLHNRELAEELFNRLKEEVPSAVLIRDDGAQAICYDERAVKRYKKCLLERRKRIIKELKALDELIDSI